MIFLYYKRRNVDSYFERHMSEQKLPPLHLVKTWIWMMTASDDDEVKTSGQEKLIASFGSMAAVQKFLDQHDV